MFDDLIATLDEEAMVRLSKCGRFLYVLDRNGLDRIVDDEGHEHDNAGECGCKHCRSWWRAIEVLEKDLCIGYEDFRDEEFGSWLEYESEDKVGYLYTVPAQLYVGVPQDEPWDAVETLVMAITDKLIDADIKAKVMLDNDNAIITIVVVN